jgi:hypothetical protein
LPLNFGLAISATGGRTQGGRDIGGLLAIAPEGAVTSAYQASLTKNGLFGENDALRLSFAQPLHVESGALQTQTLNVIDRTTGELGLVGNRIGLTAGDRRFVTEALYGTPVLKGRANLSLFGQYDTAPMFTPGESAATGGLRFTVGF